MSLGVLPLCVRTASPWPTLGGPAPLCPRGSCPRVSVAASPKREPSHRGLAPLCPWGSCPHVSVGRGRERQVQQRLRVSVSSSAPKRCLRRGSCPRVSLGVLSLCLRTASPWPTPGGPAPLCPSGSCPRVSVAASPEGDPNHRGLAPLCPWGSCPRESVGRSGGLASLCPWQRHEARDQRSCPSRSCPRLSKGSCPCLS